MALRTPASSSTTMTLGFFFMDSLLHRRQPHVENWRRAGCDRTGADSTAVSLHDGTADGQSQAGAGFLGGRERFEQAIGDRWRDARAVVGDADLDIAIRGAQPSQISTSRAPAGISASASKALRTRLSTTC